MGDFIADCLNKAGVRAVFAVPGVPITESLTAIRTKGATYVVIMRNEQAAAQAAAAYGFLAGAGCLSSLGQYSDAIAHILRLSRTNEGIASPPIAQSSDQLAAFGHLDLRPLELDSDTMRSLLKHDPLPPTPGICVTTSGPAFMYSLSGIGTSHANSWPLLLISSSNGEQAVKGLPSFQEFPQLQIAKGMQEAGVLKGSFSVTTLKQFYPKLLQAISLSLSGVPGPVYLDVHWSVWRATEPPTTQYLTLTAPLKMLVAHPQVDEEAWAANNPIEAFERTTRPLILLGDEMCYSMGSMARLLLRHSKTIIQAPILTTPMAKGLLCDGDERSASAARSMALSQSEVVIAIGVSLNWQFNNSTGWMDHKKAVYVLSGDPQCLGDLPTVRRIAGHAPALFLRFLQGVARSPVRFAGTHDAWRTEVTAAAASAVQRLASKTKEESRGQEVYRGPEQRRWQGGLQLNHFFQRFVEAVSAGEGDDWGMAFRDIGPKTVLFLSHWLGVDHLKNSLATFVAEGATSMDRSRQFLPSTAAKCRLDAAQFGAMGVGTAFAIATAVYRKTCFPHSWYLLFAISGHCLLDGARSLLADLEPSPQLSAFVEGIRSRCVTYLLQGDSAFGFSGLEFETIRRYNLPIAICVLDNGGMYAMEQERDALKPDRGWSTTDSLRHISVTDLTPDFRFTDLAKASHLPAETLSTTWDHKVADRIPCLIHVILDPLDGSKVGHIRKL
eukprot:Protomagalhaensia_sp_Gyna_25__1891@NODE_1_length_10645_cov_612_087781_g0_i0_p2_GENE_NODE_1_length_10645_cov_612_087781_g0_i0NODE_1_length_10645_cov_612_087781_g0_i0_p2_ORF_typecomplete_len732_score95_84TPP_enzyme_N/PF02776_18/1_5e24TPP_enzyme_C/PF02775_21/7_4e03TPP_enzyme_C/PF02775_21/5_9e02TPP_enzyme_C/PF02775_21/3e03TPP_enzyme_C/PF02775_21/5_5e13TPP_enzyme_M/PF00205_22/4e10TPP_enzyme_M/PF00205_22/6_6e03POR_N/PF01855_19/0_61POR_N/PF01855_19/31_NODE_1_length_10645_cov_612_087781_g0_i0844810622